MKKITKLMLTLALLLVGVTGVKAEWVEDYSIDYSTKTNFPFYVMDYVPEWVSGVMTDYGAMYTYKKTSELEGGENVVGTVTIGSTEYSKIELTEPGWHQYFIADGIPTSVGGTYTVKAMVKASKAVTINVNMGWGWGNDDKVSKNVLIGTDWAEVEWKYTEVGGTSCNLVAQPGTTTATIEWKYVKVGHEISTELQDRPEPDAPAAPAYGTSIKVIDYSTQESYPYWWMGDQIDNEPNQPYFCNESATVQIDNRALLIANTKVQTNFWDLQPFIIDNVTMKEGYNYVVRIKMNTTGAGNARVVLGTWNNNYYKDFSFADDYAYYDIELGTATFSADNNAHALLQCGSFAGKIAIDKVEVFEVLPKQELSDKIALAKKYSGVVYTAASFAELGSKITAAETALAEATDLASVQDATNALTTAINGLQLKVGYSSLSADMYKNHESLENPGEGTTTDCAYAVGTSTGQPYGDSQVHYLKWADLSAYKKLVLLVADGTPRIMMNRQEPIAEGSEGYDAHGGAYVQLTDAPVNGVVEVDLTQYSDARLNAIKGANWQNVTVLGMYLYRDMSYGIIGDLTGGWDAADVDMTPTETEGEYTLTVTDFVVNEVKAYEYKLRANDVYGIYDLPAGNENKSWTPTEGIGIYSLTFTANVLSHTLNCVATKTADFEYAVVGCTYDGSTEVQSDLFAGTKAWDTNTTDVMTKQNDGTYVWKKNEVELPAKWIDLKVVARNGENVIKWYGNATNDGNVGLNIQADGKYYVTVTFNGSYVTATAVKKEIYTVAGCYKVGDEEQASFFGTAWAAGKTENDMTRNDDGIYELKFTDVELTAAGTIKYKITQNHAWTDSWPAQDATWGVNEAGIYDITFTFNPSTNAVGCNLAIKKDISAAGYATYYSSYGIDFAAAGLEAFIAKMDGERVSFDPINDAPAKTGVLLKGTAGSYKLPIVESTTNVEGNLFKGVLTNTEVPAGIFVLLNGDEGVGFYKTTKTFTVGANTAYIEVPSEARFISLDGETTSIDVISKMEDVRGDVYNLNGQRVAQPTKGLYIINGRKVVVK